MKIYNTLTKTVEEFVPHEDGKVNMYTCGPTVYHFAHIGNLRTYIFEDILENMDIEDLSDEKSYSQYEMVRHVIVDCAVRNTKIIDEYLNTVGQCFNFFPSEEQFKLLQENLLHINDSIIDNSPVLDATQKKYILCAKYAQNRDDFFSKVHLSFRQKKKSFISIVLKLHHNHIEFNLLRNIKFPIIKFNLNLFGIIDFIFKLGK